MIYNFQIPKDSRSVRKEYPQQRTPGCEWQHPTKEWSKKKWSYQQEIGGNHDDIPTRPRSHPTWTYRYLAYPNRANRVSSSILPKGSQDFDEVQIAIIFALRIAESFPAGFNTVNEKYTEWLIVVRLCFRVWERQSILKYSDRDSRCNRPAWGCRPCLA